MYQEKDLEILISTMNRSSLDFLTEMFPNKHFSNFNLIVINQTSENEIIKKDFETVRVYNVFEKGLSKSRNLAIEKATQEILLLADDDEVFIQDFDNTIIKAFNELSDLEVIKFQFEGNPKKKYKDKIQTEMNNFDILNSSSIEIAFKRKSIQNKVFFDENFGLGTLFTMGEEPIFLLDLQKKGTKIGYYPVKIASHLHSTTSSKVDLKSRYYILGAIYYRMFNKKYFLWILIKLFFDLKQRKLPFAKICKVISEAIKGKKTYAKQL